MSRYRVTWRCDFDDADNPEHAVAMASERLAKGGQETFDVEIFASGKNSASTGIWISIRGFLSKRRQ